jgi:hypothetical protein
LITAKLRRKSNHSTCDDLNFASCLAEAGKSSRFRRAKPICLLQVEKPIPSDSPLLKKTSFRDKTSLSFTTSRSAFLRLISNYPVSEPVFDRQCGQTIEALSFPHLRPLLLASGALASSRALKTLTPSSLAVDRHVPRQGIHDRRKPPCLEAPPFRAWSFTPIYKERATWFQPSHPRPPVSS